MKEKILSVNYDRTPIILIRVISPKDDKYTTRHKKKYPFYLDNTIIFEVETNLRKFNFTIPRGYVWNGADIPKILFFVGQSKDNNYLIASMVHDYLIEYRYFILNDVLEKSITMSELRRLTSLIFRQILKDQKTNTIKANIMAFAVDIYQSTFCFKGWRDIDENIG